MNITIFLELPESAEPIDDIADDAELDAELEAELDIVREMKEMEVLYYSIGTLI
jgi:hypothetical protein